MQSGISSTGCTLAQSFDQVSHFTFFFLVGSPEVPFPSGLNTSGMAQGRVYVDEAVPTVRDTPSARDTSVDLQQIVPHK